LDIAIFGRDTVSITGKIEPQEVNVFYEFATEDIGSAIAEDQGIIMSYNLNIPLRNKAFFQNSQIDAEINGELNLSQIGYQEIDFGGQIIVDAGSAFTHKDNFENLNGVVTFDNKGFNPLINLSAYTMIDNERIELRMVGGIDDPEIILESASGFSESDILELLTWGKRFEDQEGTSTGFGNQTVSFLGALLETQLEKNIKESNISMINYFDDINISGAAGFLQGSSEDFKLAAKKQIGDKTFLNLSYKRSFSLNDQSQLGVEYKLNRHFSVVANVGKDGNYNVKYRYKYAY
jgi:autotransporter translocation and assembly factor TamB